MVRLAPDLLRIVPFDDGTLYKEVTPANYTEGPFMLRHRGKYYFMWSEGGWTGPDYCVAYAIADSPFGPFERIGKILEQDPAIACGAGHHSVIQVPGRDEWYIVYHRRPLNETAASSRETCIDRMYFDLVPAGTYGERMRRHSPSRSESQRTSEFRNSSLYLKVSFQPHPCPPVG